jgi:hypothetical protein
MENQQVAQHFICHECEEEFSINQKKLFCYNFMLNYCQNMERKTIEVCPHCFLFLKAEEKSEYEYTKY